MLTKFVLTAVAFAATGAVVAQDKPAAEKPAAEKPAVPAAGASPTDPKSMSGMSILGNQDAPKSLVIVPW